MTHIRDQLTASLAQLVRQLLRKVDQTLPRLVKYTGKVVTNLDPERLGRCQIRVFGVFDESIADKDLPWALPDFCFVGTVKGSFIVPEVNTIVRVYFENGDYYSPVYEAKAVDRNNLPSQKDTDYPNNMVFFETQNGDYLYVNRTTGEAKYNQRTGTKIVIQPDGTVRIDDVFKNITIMTDGEVVLHSENTVRLDAKEKVVIGSSGGYVVTSPYPGKIVTQDGHILTAQSKVQA